MIIRREIIDYMEGRLKLPMSHLFVTKGNIQDNVDLGDSTETDFNSDFDQLILEGALVPRSFEGRDEIFYTYGGDLEIMGKAHMEAVVSEYY